MGHDEGLWRCMCEILRVPLDTGVLARDTASLPLALGGLGLRSAVRSRQSTYWASWADTLPVVRMRHRAIAESFVEALVTGVGPVSLVEAEDCRRNLTGVMGFEPPSWSALVAGARPLPPPLDDPGGWRTGWQHEAASRVERHFCDTGLRAVPCPVLLCPLRQRFHTRIESHLFRLLLLRRLRLPLPPCVPVCRCGRPLDSFGHRAACPRAGLLARRGFAVEMAAAKVCREAGARVTTNVLVCDLDLGVPHPALDGRRLEVVAEGLPLFGGVQLALDTTLVSPVRADGTARPGAAQRDGVALVSARSLKERTRLVVLAGEVGSRWSGETSNFLRLLTAAKARTTRPPAESGVCLAGQVGCDLVLRCRTGVRLLVAEPS